MTRVLVATASVHTTAAACDYLDGRLDSDDTVVVLTVEDDTVAGRDAGDAANVARTRLFEPTIETITREGEPATEIRQVAEQENIDQIVLGKTRGDPEVAGTPPGSTVRTVLAESEIPVVVLPV
jgi:nucleotide-binding universal stress UspA family protein